jgi:hypothetical protein
MRVEILSDHPGKLLNDATKRRLAKRAAAQTAVARVAELRKQRAVAFSSGRLFAWFRLWFAVANAKKQVPPPSMAGSVPTGKEEAARAGKRAEDEVAAELGERLNDDWLLFRGYRNRKGEIDQVLVGPGGLVAIEVKNYNATVAIDGDVWNAVKVGNYGEVIGRRVLEDARGRTPSVQLNEPADALAAFLKQFGQPVDVERVVLLVHPKALVERHDHPTVVVGKSVDAVLKSRRQRLNRAQRSEIERLIRRDHNHWEKPRSGLRGGRGWRLSEDLFDGCRGQGAIRPGFEQLQIRARFDELTAGVRQDELAPVEQVEEHAPVGANFSVCHPAADERVVIRIDGHPLLQCSPDPLGYGDLDEVKVHRFALIVERNNGFEYFIQNVRILKIEGLRETR